MIKNARYPGKTKKTDDNGGQGALRPAEDAAPQEPIHPTAPGKGAVEERTHLNRNDRGEEGIPIEEATKHTFTQKEASFPADSDTQNEQFKDGNGILGGDSFRAGTRPRGGLWAGSKRGGRGRKAKKRETLYRESVTLATIFDRFRGNFKDSGHEDGQEG